ncbi:MAG: 3'-5' exonuclease domain-containing protein 2 [Bacteroidaceae bacterium]|nr:3'-5' exonuclease domain-containing protein 2 [Bacteroidaceae bacterium]
MKILTDLYDKNKLSTLPRAVFPGRIYIIQTAQEAERAVNYLLSQSILGFDTETRPSFRKGHPHSTALLQVACHEACFLFRLNLMEGLPAPIVRLLQDNSVTKVGLSLHDDFHCLSRRAKFKPGTFIELQNEVKRIGIKDMSLQKIYANLFGEKIAKNQQLSNWEADVLSPGQQLYAATDAWACIRIHEEITRLILTQDYKIEINEQDIPETRQR